jgi:hypothetical protein
MDDELLGQTIARLWLIQQGLKHRGVAARLVHDLHSGGKRLTSNSGSHGEKT